MQLEVDPLLEAHGLYLLRVARARTEGKPVQRVENLPFFGKLLEKPACLVRVGFTGVRGKPGNHSQTQRRHQRKHYTIAHLKLCLLNY